MSTPALQGRKAAAHVMLEAIRKNGGPLDDVEFAAAAHVLMLTLGAVDSTTPPDPVAILRAAADVFRGTADRIAESADQIEKARDAGDDDALRAGSDLLRREQQGAA